MFDDSFEGPELSTHWTRTCPGGGTLTSVASTLRLAIPPSAAGRYADAQIDDYGNLPRAGFPWRPPLRLEVRARTSRPQAVRSTAAPANAQSASTLLGTAGFGFWNYPFSLTGSVLTLPEAAWFFYASPPSNMALVPNSWGCGWKAQVVHARRWGALAALAPTAAAALWARLTGRETAAANWLQRLSGTHESLLAASMAEWHDYALEWHLTSARFFVDGVMQLDAPAPPGPLGFVAWIDNQYAVATPRGTLRFGTLSTPQTQWLELDHIRIQPL